MIQIINSNDLEVIVDLKNGGRIASVNFHGYEFAIPNNQKVLHWGWYPMVPWAGRVNKGEYLGPESNVRLPTDLMPPHAIHGFGHSTVWRDEGEGISSCEFEGSFAGASAVQQIKIIENTLRYKLEYVANSCELPAWLGLHTWFPWRIGSSPKAIIDFSASKMLELSTDGIPSGELIPASEGPWDDTFTNLIGMPKITWPGIASIEIESDVDWWTIYTKDENVFCVEPLNAPPDAIRIGRLVGNTHNLEVIFSFNQDLNKIDSVKQNGQ
jgi:aldose 1-epimerase